MATKSNGRNNGRGIHVSAGVYTSETELSYASKSLGITTLGLVGETVKGPAFQVMPIESWREFQDVFGGTNASKFRDSQYPKYELPYIAKSYLSESNQLQVCRVLGLSGYNAGPAWLITASGKNTYNDMVIAVLRSRGRYDAYFKDSETDSCNDTQSYDVQRFAVGEKDGCVSKKTEWEMDAVALSDYSNLKINPGDNCNSDITYTSTTESEIAVNSLNYGKFNIQITGSTGNKYTYSVSLNPQDNDYILKVLGTSNDDGDAPLYVESLYDVALQQGIEKGEIIAINKKLQKATPYYISNYVNLDAVDGIMRKSEETLSRKDLKKRFLCDSSGFTCHDYYSDDNKEFEQPKTGSTKVGYVYTVVQYTDLSGKRHYYYKNIYDKNDDNTLTPQQLGDTVVYNKENSLYYRLIGDKVKPITFDMNNYKERYRYASTPWFVSNLKGDAKKMEINRLFRFHTISDGDYANNEVKVSIENIRPDEGCFDVMIRDINDTDESIVVYESFRRCTLIQGDSNYIGYKIGTSNGDYEVKSKYITVEVNEGTTVENSVPCGFMGYPLGYLTDPIGVHGKDSITCKAPIIVYNTDFDEDIKIRRQYFGLSNISGVDIDLFTYKGVTSYNEEPNFLSKGFHLDSRLSLVGVPSGMTLTVDGEAGYMFEYVSPNSRTFRYDGDPIISTEMDMSGSIYEDPKTRKFTCYFYGGFDGWDIYRGARTIGDEFTRNKYRGKLDKKTNEGYSFNLLTDSQDLLLNEVGITSDYYAYLSAIKQFANPEETDINVFATPGIDLINNKLLSQEVIDMIEDERADSIYVATMPDKPYGASDMVSDMYTADDAVYDLEDTEIDSNYTCTYFPWVKYFDQDNSQYIYLPPTKDVVRNMALTDNTAYPWFAPAGLQRGDVNCVRARMTTRLSDEDTLYSGRINPIKTFASDGVKIWGQKNLQIAETQLNRIAVRRLLLRMRKLVSIACLSLIFEQNDATTKAQFMSLVTPIMENLRSNRAISDYRIEVNDTVEARERRELPAKIYFKPIGQLEYIDIQFVVSPEGVSFDDI